MSEPTTLRPDIEDWAEDARLMKQAAPKGSILETLCNRNLELIAWIRTLEHPAKLGDNTTLDEGFRLGG